VSVSQRVISSITASHGPQLLHAIPAFPTGPHMGLSLPLSLAIHEGLSLFKAPNHNISNSAFLFLTSKLNLLTKSVYGLVLRGSETS
jgi:hypothetical protein